MGALLVVDGEVKIRDILFDLFENDHVCHLAQSAEQALGWLEAGIEAYDVVLSDISLPGLSGLELLARIRQSWPTLPVIIISTIEDKQHSGGLAQLGAFAHLAKPFRPEEVRETVIRAIKYHQRLQEDNSHYTSPGGPDAANAG